MIFVRNPGDTWAFTIIGDRLPIAGIIVLIYFGVMRSHPVLGLTLVLVVAYVLINLLVDLSYGFFDPRVRIGKEKS